MEARNQVLALHGQSILNSKKERCERCWFRENNRCGGDCEMYNLPSDPVEASKRYLSHQNNIQIFPFLCMYMVPVYEKLTGSKNTMEKILKTYVQRMT